MSCFALDARKVDDFGIGSYLRGLVRAMVPLLGEDELALLGDPPALGTAFGTAFGTTFGTELGTLPRVRSVEERSALYSLAELRALPRSARGAGAELLHVPHYTLPFARSLPTVVTIHDLIHLRFSAGRPLAQRLYARWMLGRAVRSATAILTVSEATRRELVERFGRRAERALAIPNGVDERFFAPVAREEIERLRVEHGLPDRYLLFVGNPMPHKNLERLLIAYRGVRAVLPDAPPFVLAGSRQDRVPALLRLCAEAGVADQVRIVPFLEEARLPALYGGATLLAIPSLWEGFGLPAAEAMAVGTPVVAANRGGLPEVVGAAASLVDPEDGAAIRSAILTLLGDSSLRARLADAGRERARRFRWPVAAERTLELYRSLVAGGGSRRPA